TEGRRPEGGEEQGQAAGPASGDRACGDWASGHRQEGARTAHGTQTTCERGGARAEKGFHRRPGAGKIVDSAMASTISLQPALAAVAAAPCGRTPAETVPLASALGRTLAAAVATDGPWPPTDRSAMDGFALTAGPGLAAGSRLRVVGESLAGHPFAGA